MDMCNKALFLDRDGVVNIERAMCILVRASISERGLRALSDGHKLWVISIWICRRASLETTYRTCSPLKRPELARRYSSAQRALCRGNKKVIAMFQVLSKTSAVDSSRLLSKRRIKCAIRIPLTLLSVHALATERVLPGDDLRSGGYS